MLQLCQHGGWNQNLLVKLGEEIDLPDQNQLIYRRRVRDDNHVERGLSPLSSATDGAFHGLARNPLP